MEIHAAYRWLTEDCEISQEWMISSATMIAAFLVLIIHHVDARFVCGKPESASMKLVEPGNAYDETGFV